MALQLFFFPSFVQHNQSMKEKNRKKLGKSFSFCFPSISIFTKRRDTFTNTHRENTHTDSRPNWEKPTWSLDPVCSGALAA